MKKSIRIRLLSAFLCLIMLVPYAVMFTSSAVQVYGDTASELESAKDKKEDINQQIKDTEKKLEELKKQTDDLGKYLAKLDEQMAELDFQLYNMNIQIEDLTKQIGQAEADLAVAEEDADYQYEMMKLRIKFMYEHNEEGYLALMLSAESIGDMLNKAEYISKISSYDRNMLEEYKNTITYIAEAKAKLEADYVVLENNKHELEVNKAALETMQKEKEVELANYNKQIAQQNDIQDHLHADLSHLEDQIVAMEEKIKREEEEAKKNQNASTQPLPSTGVFLWPTISRRITSRYGATANRPYPHQGVDIGAVKPGVWGDPIYAADGGVVTLAAYDSGAGNWIWIHHGNGLYTVYMHCSKFLVSVGDVVKKGDTIALMGSTGNSTGAHLHFAVRVDGQYVNPEPYIGIK